MCAFSKNAHDKKKQKFNVHCNYNSMTLTLFLVNIYNYLQVK